MLGAVVITLEQGQTLGHQGRATAHRSREASRRLGELTDVELLQTDPRCATRGQTEVTPVDIDLVTPKQCLVALVHMSEQECGAGQQLQVLVPARIVGRSVSALVDFGPTEGPSSLPSVG